MTYRLNEFRFALPDAACHDTSINILRFDALGTSLIVSRSLLGEDETLLSNLDGQLQRLQHQCLRHYHTDLNGLHERLTDDQGEEQWRICYATWGRSYEEHRALGFADEQNLRFQGRYMNRESGRHYNLFRYYDPDVERWARGARCAA